MKRRPTALARALRRRSTAAEAKLWSALRNRALDGAKFRRQHPIGPYVVDFCCPEKRLVVEVDGDAHAGREDKDQERARRLESLGYRVLRFTNREVAADLELALRVIWETGETHPHPQPLSLQGRGEFQPDPDETC